VKLGPNLVENGRFEESMGGWNWSDMFSQDPFSAAAFTGGTDTLLFFEGRQAARVDGLWIEQGNEYPARAGFSQQNEITLEMNVPYLLSLFYYTARVSEDQAATIWVSYHPETLWAQDYELPATNGRWHHLVIVGWTRSGVKPGVRPLLRTFSTGTVRFDGVELRLIELPKETKIDPTLYFWNLPLKGCPLDL
jgi:hypothetical protein